VSTVDQAKSGLGLVAQEAAIKEAADRNGWDLIEIVRDEGRSAKDLERPGLYGALEEIAEGRADGLVVAKLDRASRSLVDVTRLIDWFQRAGAEFVALDVGLDTSTPSGKLVANIMASVGEWERETIAKRTSEALRARQASGLAAGRPGVADTNPGLAERIQTARRGGATWQRIADDLNAEGVPTVRGGERWRVSAVQAAAGYRRPPSKPKVGELPPLRRRRASAGTEASPKRAAGARTAAI
jgi:DNA invertase Pin-like site-specific DNA recombinase